MQKGAMILTGFGTAAVILSGGSSIAEEVRRNLLLLLGTREGEQALDVEFGLSQDFLDLPPPAAKAAYAAEVVTKVAKYEPRVQVDSVDFTADASGVLYARVEVRVINE